MSDQQGATAAAPEQAPDPLQQRLSEFESRFSNQVARQLGQFGEQVRQGFQAIDQRVQQVAPRIAAAAPAAAGVDPDEIVREQMWQKPTKYSAELLGLGEQRTRQILSETLAQERQQREHEDYWKNFWGWADANFASRREWPGIFNEGWSAALAQDPSLTNDPGRCAQLADQYAQKKLASFAETERARAAAEQAQQRQAIMPGGSQPGRLNFSGDPDEEIGNAQADNEAYVVSLMRRTREAKSEPREFLQRKGGAEQR